MAYEPSELALQQVLRSLQAGLYGVSMRRGGANPAVRQLALQMRSVSKHIPIIRHLCSHAQSLNRAAGSGLAQPAIRCYAQIPNSSAPQSWHPASLCTPRMNHHVSCSSTTSCSYTSTARSSWSRMAGMASAQSHHRMHTLASRPCQMPTLSISRAYGAAQGHHATLVAGPSQSWQVAMRRMQYAWNESHVSWPLVLPTWWPAWEAVYRSSVKWLPTMPGARAAYLDVLSALNVAGAGGRLLTTAALTAVELSRATGKVAAEGFAMAMPAHLITVTETNSADSPGTWVVSAALSFLEAVANITRAMWLAIIFAPVLLSAPLALQLNMYRAEWMELLRRTLEAGGPAFIKWGQWAATRHDVFPPDMCAELEMLHSQAPAHAFRHTRRAIAESFGMPHTELFESIDKSPVASGSIGQVHRARLSDKGAALTGFEPGQVVAVKVRHPGVADTILRDFSTMLFIAHVMSLLPAMAHLRLEDTLKQFAAPLKEQVDLAREASNLQRFNYNFRQTRAVQFPVPLYPLVSSEVLVETYEEGDHISRYISQADGSPINHRLSIIGSGTMLQMMLMDNLIHSDLHPGNILVRLTPPGGLLGGLYSCLDSIKRSQMVSNTTRARLDVLQQHWLQPQMVLLDVGMATELSDEDQVNMVGLFRSFAAMDGEACGHWTLKFSGSEQQCPDPQAFKEAMESTFKELRRLDEGESWQDVAFTNSADSLAHVLELVRQYHVTLPGHICAVVVTTMVLEGWSNKLDPTHSVLTQVQKMFEATNVPWKTRLVQTVDHVMQEAPDQQAMLDS